MKEYRIIIHLESFEIYETREKAEEAAAKLRSHEPHLKLKGFIQRSLESIPEPVIDVLEREFISSWGALIK